MALGSKAKFGRAKSDPAIAARDTFARPVASFGAVSFIHGLAPIARADAVVLILGTMPGKESLRLAQYYAHPRNSFWPLICDVLKIEPSLSYAERVERLAGARVAVWDVLQLCTRETCLDSDIDDPVANDFQSFLAQHSQIGRIYFNGAVAEHLFRRHVKALVDEKRSVVYERLPSTSPANASVNFKAKLAAWQAIAP